MRALEAEGGDRLALVGSSGVPSTPVKQTMSPGSGCLAPLLPTNAAALPSAPAKAFVEFWDCRGEAEQWHAGISRPLDRGHQQRRRATEAERCRVRGNVFDETCEVDARSVFEALGKERELTREGDILAHEEVRRCMPCLRKAAKIPNRWEASQPGFRHIFANRVDLWMSASEAARSSRA